MPPVMHILNTSKLTDNKDDEWPQVRQVTGYGCATVSAQMWLFGSPDVVTQISYRLIKAVSVMF